MNSTEQFIQDVIDQIVRNIIISLQQIICKQKHDRKIFYITISFKKTPFVTSRLTFKCIKHSKFSNKQFKTSEKKYRNDKFGINIRFMMLTIVHYGVKRNGINQT